MPRRYARWLLLAILLTFAAFPRLGSEPAAAQDEPAIKGFHFFDNPPEANDLMIGIMDGRTVKLSDLRGSVVVLNFWRKDCRYCHQEKQYLKKMIQELGDKDLMVICVNLWDEPSYVKSYAGSNPGGLVFAHKAGDKMSVLENMVKGRLMGYYVLNDDREATYEIKGFPSTYVIDRDWKVVAAHLGMARWEEPEVQNWLVSLISKDQSPAETANLDYELPEWLDSLLSRPIHKGPRADNAAPALAGLFPLDEDE